MKKWIFGGMFALITAITLAFVLLNGDSTSTQFDQYKKYSSQVHTVDWTISEDTARTFADANCDKLAVGDMPAIRFMNDNHVKSSASVIAAYCPKSLDNFLAGVIMKYPEYKGTALYINEELRNVAS